MGTKAGALLLALALRMRTSIRPGPRHVPGAERRVLPERRGRGRRARV